MRSPSSNSKKTFIAILAVGVMMMVVSFLLLRHSANINDGQKEIYKNIRERLEEQDYQIQTAIRAINDLGSAQNRQIEQLGEIQFATNNKDDQKIVQHFSEIAHELQRIRESLRDLVPVDQSAQFKALGDSIRALSQQASGNDYSKEIKQITSSLQQLKDLIQNNTPQNQQVNREGKKAEKEEDLYDEELYYQQRQQQEQEELERNRIEEQKRREQEEAQQREQSIRLVREIQEANDWYDGIQADDDYSEEILTHMITMDRYQDAVADDKCFFHSLPELFEGNRTIIWRLGFPGTSSTNMRSMLVRGANQTSEIRAQGCKNLCLVGCNNRDGPSLEHFRYNAGGLKTDYDIGQHVSYSRKAAFIYSRQIVHCDDCNRHSLATTMLREPSQYTHRVWLEKNVRSMNDSRKVIHFDMTFTERTGLAIEDVTKEEWMEKSYWRWNYFTRGLAGEYPNSLWLRLLSDDAITYERALLLNQLPLTPEANEVLLAAKQRLLSMPFFGIYDRLEESMELLAFTFCWDFDALGFSFQKPSRFSKQLVDHLGRGQEIIGKPGMDIMKNRFKLDLLLFKWAEQIFDYRVEKMRKAMDQGFICQLSDSQCGLRCLDTPGK